MNYLNDRQRRSFVLDCVKKSRTDDFNIQIPCCASETSNQNCCANVSRSIRFGRSSGSCGCLPVQLTDSNALSPSPYSEGKDIRVSKFGRECAPDKDKRLASARENASNAAILL